MDNKYKELMSNIEVSDEMRSRILQNIGEMDIKPRATRITPVSARRRATVSRIIGIVAAAGIVLTVGGVILLRHAAGNQTKSADMEMTDDAVAHIESLSGTRDNIQSFTNGADEEDKQENSVIEAPSAEATEPTEAEEPPAEAVDETTKGMVSSYELNNKSGHITFRGVGNSASSSINKIVYEDEDGTTYVLTDVDSIDSIISKYKGDEGGSADSVKLQVFAGDMNKEIIFYGPEVAEIISIIKDKGVIS